MIPFLSWYKNPLNIRLFLRERLWYSLLLQRVFISFALLICAWGGCMFAHVSHHSHPAPWVVVGSLPSWERLFFFSLSFIYFFVMVVLEVVLVLVVPFVLYLCKKFICCCWKISACGPRALTDLGWPGQFLYKFLLSVSDDWSSCWCQCFLSGYKLHRLILFINFWTISLPNLFLKLVASIYKSELGTLRWNTFC